MTKHHVTSAAHLYLDMNPDCLLLVLLLVARGRQRKKNGFRVALCPCSPPQLHLGAGCLNISLVSAWGWHPGILSVLPRTSTSTPSTHGFPLPLGQFCFFSLKTALTFRDWCTPTWVLPAWTTKSCVFPMNVLLLGKLHEINFFFPIFELAPPCFALLKRKVPCLCHQIHSSKQGLPHLEAWTDTQDQSLLPPVPSWWMWFEQGSSQAYTILVWYKVCYIISRTELSSTPTFLLLPQKFVSSTHVLANARTKSSSTKPGASDVGLSHVHLPRWWGSSRDVLQAGGSERVMFL